MSAVPPAAGATVRRYELLDLDVSGLVGQATEIFGLPPPPVYGLIHAPRKARFLLLGDAKFLDEEGEANLAQAFELRFFSGKGEIFWRRDGATGRAVLTLDGDKEAQAPWQPVVKGLEGLSVLKSGNRLLWGKYDPKQDSPHGWRRFTDARIGELFVPDFGGEPRKGDRAVLRVVEYARAADDGNVVPAGERLKGFDWRRSAGS